ncbi:MAG: hypothetical protein ACRDKX_09480, partial [Solirubrobacterales bacterium]
VMAGTAESGNDREVATLVGKEPHRLVPTFGGPFADEDDLFVSQRVGSVADGCLDILALQRRIAIERVVVDPVLSFELLVWRSVALVCGPAPSFVWSRKSIAASRSLTKREVCCWSQSICGLRGVVMTGQFTAR